MSFKAKNISKNIWWVGAIDWNLRNFHGYLTPRGSTYNAYLIVDEKVALIDTAKKPFAPELMERVSSVLPVEKIDYVIANHVEMDHSGSLAAIKQAAPKAKLVADARAAQDINRHFKQNWEFQVVKTGDVLSLGSRSLNFVEVPMVHWPDSMVTYCPEEKILFSNDAFGQHLATYERFDDQLNWNDLRAEAAKYYANIVLPFAAPTTKALSAVAGLEIQTICPSHGLIWRKNVGEIISCYKDWAANKTKPKAVIVYDTMWNSTEQMALAIAEGISSKGIGCKIFDLKITDISEIMKEILEAKAIIVGSPTLNNGMLPTVGGFLTYLKGLKPQNRIGFTFGSFGWGGGSVKAIEAELKATGIELVKEAITAKYIPDENELENCYQSGQTVAKLIKNA
ncbi:MAG: FprA family A-type flavoprotein [Pseudomonadota bacterium]